ncbi:DNA-binding transcriptional regulator, XRE family [Proteiniborus ethanoligenes]|uniref:DNA-binding transcriptional regulator, XRE family n=1 Tax=Proteiniborus ethanoligenes TaxID=415015 RepID=A0A1H3RZ25_9FIRM|nr:helix-turn-helix transcriptional regulator [Proteiniborus ethanoligenes]SDZ30525.1 DNA-binding transcriptional regulator, XRE family [Proteiniborus ethanoligenes]
MGYNYDKLWKLLIDKKMNKEELRKRTGMSSTTLARMGKDENVSLDVLGRICKELECDIGDIISYKG